MLHRSRGRIRNLLPHGGVVAALICAGLLFTGAGHDRQSSIPGFPDDYIPPDATGVTVDATVVTTGAANVAPADAAVWKDGELVALPKDAEKRRAARAEARANTAAKKTRIPAATYTPVLSGATEPVTRGKWANPFPQSVARPEPLAWDRANMNIHLPDDFVLPADVLARITEESGHIDRAAEMEMSSVVAQSLIQSFHGISQTTLTPPDCDIAVGPQHVVVVVNSDYAVFDYCGNQLAAGDLGDLAGYDYFLFDPKVIYDEWDDRWLISFAARDTPNQIGYIRLVISSGSEPPGIGNYWWYTYNWSGSSGGWWGDYPDLGFDADAVYITTNDFNWSNPAVFQRARITVLDKTEIYNSAGSVRHDFYAMTNPGDGTLAFALRPAEMKSDPGEYYLVSSKPGGASFLSWFEILGTPSTTLTLNSYSIPCGTYDNPPNMLQGDGTYADCGDARLLCAKYYLSRLWTTHAQRINYTGGAGDESAIEVYIIDTVNRTIAQESGGWGGGADLFYCYPSVDFDPLDRGVVSFLRGGVSVYPEARFTDFSEGGSFSSSALLAAGTDWKDDTSNAGTNADPYRLGDYNGCDLNRDGDNRTLWFFGHRAVTNGDWDTHVGAVCYDGAGYIIVTPTTNPLVSTGFIGGPFSPPGHQYTVTNTGGARMQWDLTGVASWNTASSDGGFLNPGSTAYVDVDINSVANGYAAGTYLDNYHFNDCMSGAYAARSTQLTIGLDGSCNGSIVDLAPGVPFDHLNASDNNQERGAYITALQDFQVCSIGVEMDLAVPQTLTARIYAANGTTRGALLATGSVTAVQPGKVITYIPIGYTLLACQEYDIAVEFGTTNAWDYWDDRPITPFDVGGVIRVRDGESAGSAGNFALMKFSVIGEALDSPELADLHPGVPPPSISTDGIPANRGVYVLAERTFHLNSFGWLTDAPAGSQLTARIYEASGLTRGALIASGTYTSPAGGTRWHDLPVNVVLEEGKEYDLSISYPVIGNWEWWDERVLAEPFTVGPLRVLDAHYAGNAVNFALLHFRANHGPYVAGHPLDLAIPTPVSTSSSTLDNGQYGAFIESMLDQEVYSLGWFADVVEGETITARVYELSGTTIGALLSEGTVVAAAGDETWHDVPVAASLESGTTYAIDIEWNDINVWHWWNDTVGTPYNVQNRVMVLEGMSQSHPNPDPAGNYALPHLRMNTCEPTATAVEDGPTAPPAFVLHAPYPNPTRDHAVLGYELDEAGPVNLTIYNVAGQRVKTLLDARRPVGPGEVQIDTGGMAAGVYFVKMATQTKSVTRKITIVR